MEPLEERIKKYVSGYRLEHTISVAEECKKLASLFSLDGKQLECAGLLHDITKELDYEKQLALCKKLGVFPDGSTLSSPKTLHQFTAACLIPYDFPEYATDTVISAVKYHTTGKKDMTLEEKLLYLADYIEPLRTFDDCIKVRDFFYSSNPTEKHLNDTLILSLKLTLDDLISKNKNIHIFTIDFYNDLINKAEIQK